MGLPYQRSAGGCLIEAGRNNSAAPHFMMLDRDDLDDRQQHLFDLLLHAFEDEPALDAASGPVLYGRLRRHLTDGGATDADFGFLTGQLVRLVVESDNPPEPREKAAQLMLISSLFARRTFSLVIKRGAVADVELGDRPTTH